MTAPLTPRQTEALAWIERAGRASSSAILNAGFTRRTFDSLADRGLVAKTSIAGSLRGGVRYSHPSYRPPPYEGSSWTGPADRPA